MPPSRERPPPSRLGTASGARQQTEVFCPARVVARSRNALVFLDPRTVWAFEAAGRLTFVNSCEGRFDVDLGLAALEASFGGALLRVHRNWLVNPDYVRALERQRGARVLLVGTSIPHERIRVPVSRDRAQDVRALLLRGATGIRQHAAQPPPRTRALR